MPVSRDREIAKEWEGGGGCSETETLKYRNKLKLSKHTTYCVFG